MAIYIIIAIVVVVLIYVATTYNTLIKYTNMMKEAFSTMDVYLKKRWDLIPNLVETVKGYAKHEENTFKEITQLRTGSYDTMTDEQKLNVNQQLSQGISKIMAVAESYPELKANQNFLELSKELSKIEDEIANSRKYYNGTVRKYNDKIQMVPSNIVAGLFGFRVKEMFETSEEQKNNVKVEF